MGTPFSLIFTAALGDRSAGVSPAVRRASYPPLVTLLKPFYFVTVPQAIRSPALPAGSDFMSSAFA
jgi:hypothetical protein